TLPPVEIYAPKLFQYLVDRFEMFETFSGGPFGYKIAALRREDGPPPGRPLLGDALGGSLRIERDGGAREGAAHARSRATSATRCGVARRGPSVRRWRCARLRAARACSRCRSTRRRASAC